MDPIDGDQVYAVEKLLDKRTRQRKPEYLVKWKGWSTKHNTWESRDNILDERLIQEFEESRPAEKPSATKRKNAAQAKDSVSSSSSSAAAPAVPAKRGRRTTRGVQNETNNASDNNTTSPSTSVGTRRSNRSAASVVGHKTADGERSAAPETDSELLTDYEQSEPEPSKKKSSVASKVSPKKAEPKDDGEENNGSSEEGGEKEPESGQAAEAPKDEQPASMEVSSAEESSFSELGASADTSKPEDATATKEAGEQQEEVTPPLEIYVERRQKVEESVENGGSSVKSTTTTDVSYIITGENDPKVSHKLQVFTVPKPNKSSSSADEVAQAPNEKQAAASNGNGTKDEEDFVILQGNSFYETKVWSDGNEAPLPPQQSSSSSQANTESYQYNSSNIITEVKVKDSTMTLLEI